MSDTGLVSRRELGSGSDSEFDFRDRLPISVRARPKFMVSFRNSVR